MVLDASGAIEFLLDTARGRKVGARLADDAEVVHAPHLIDIEIAMCCGGTFWTGPSTKGMRSGRSDTGGSSMWNGTRTSRSSTESRAFATTSPRTTRSTWLWRERSGSRWLPRTGSSPAPRG